MGSTGATLRLYKHVHQKLPYFQNTKAIEHVSATVLSHLPAYLKTHTSWSIALPAEGYRLIAEKCRSAFVFKKLVQFDGDERVVVCLPLNLTGDVTLPVATFVWRWWTLGFCQVRKILHITAKVYNIQYCQKCILYNTAKSLYYTILPNVVERIRLKPIICLNLKKVRTKSQIQVFEDILTSRPSKHSSFLWYRQHRFHSRLQDWPRRRSTCLSILETFIEKKLLRSSLSVQNIKHMTGSMTCREFRNRSSEVANL